MNIRTLLLSRRTVLALGLALIAAGAFGWSTLHPRVQSGIDEAWIEDGMLVVNGMQMHSPAALVGVCENGRIWILQRLAYGPRSWRWGRLERGNFTEDPLLSQRPTIIWRASPVPEC